MMALVADSVNHIFTPSHRRGEFADHRASEPNSNTRPSDRDRDAKGSRGHMSNPAGSQQSYRASSSSDDDDQEVTPTPAQEQDSSNHQSDARTRDSQNAMETTPEPEGENKVTMSSPEQSLHPPVNRIQVRDLAHIHSFASRQPQADIPSMASSGQGGNMQYEISGMPIENIIEMVAGLLTKITSTNDMQHEHLHRQMPPADSGASISQQTSSVLAFHGKNVPSITILSYLNRINKYCPTSYEVFLSLLVYFDRMTEKVNSGPIRNAKETHHQAGVQNPDSEMAQPAKDDTQKQGEKTQTITPPTSGTLDSQDQQGAIPGTPHSRYQDSPPSRGLHPSDSDLNLSHFFVVDSFNIHRLVIAGVTCASKFFSDIFYTNSRYAKVGGLPLPELNHLELQFLLLNDFRLSVPVEELEAYGTMLVEFYAREATANA